MNARVRGVKARGPKVSLGGRGGALARGPEHKKMAGDNGGGGLHNARLFVAAVRLGYGR
jgi:hypothetical protein